MPLKTDWVINTTAISSSTLRSDGVGGRLRRKGLVQCGKDARRGCVVFSDLFGVVKSFLNGVMK